MLYMCVMDIMNVLRTGMSMSISHIQIWLYNRFSFLLSLTRSGRLAEIRGFVCISKFLNILCISFSRTDSGLCTYHLFVGSNLNFLHNSQWIIFRNQL